MSETGEVVLDLRNRAIIRDLAARQQHEFIEELERRR
jgi:hypothetical protein